MPSPYVLKDARRVHESEVRDLIKQTGQPYDDNGDLIPEEVEDIIEMNPTMQVTEIHARDHQTYMFWDVTGYVWLFAVCRKFEGASIEACKTFKDVRKVTSIKPAPEKKGNPQ